MDQNFEVLLSEKSELERALSSVQELLQRTTDEKEQIHRLFQDFKGHFEVIKQQCGQYQRRLVDEITARKDLEKEYESKLGDMRKAIEVKQKEMESMSQKIGLPIDTDILRMRVQKEVESRFRMELESKAMELERTQEAFYELKRHNEVLRTSIENIRYESDKVVGEMKERHKLEVDELVEENQRLHLRVDEGKDREVVRQVRRDLEEQKRKVEEALGEAAELRKERDVMKMDKNEMVIGHAKEIEEERGKRRSAQTENEKLKFRVRCLEDDQAKLQLKVEKKTAEANSIQNEKNSVLGILKEKEILLDSTKRQLNEAKEELHLKGAELEHAQYRQSEELKEQGIFERKEKSRLQKEFEILERNYLELEQQRKCDVQNLQSEYEGLQKLYRVCKEERQLYLEKLQKVELELEEGRQMLERKGDECEMSEKEYHKLQEKHREVINSEYNLQLVKDHLEAQIRVAQEQIEKITGDYNEDVSGWKKERYDLQKRLGQMGDQAERAKDDGQRDGKRLKGKVQEYKEKVKKANVTINLLITKITQLEREKKEGISKGEVDLREAGRDSQASNRGSEIMIKQAIHHLENDPYYQEEINKLSQEKNQDFRHH